MKEQALEKPTDCSIMSKRNTILSKHKCHSSYLFVQTAGTDAMAAGKESSKSKREI